MPLRWSTATARAVSVGHVNGAMVILKTLGTRWLNLCFFILFIKVLAHRPYGRIPVNAQGRHDRKKYKLLNISCHVEMKITEFAVDILPLKTTADV